MYEMYSNLSHHVIFVSENSPQRTL